MIKKIILIFLFLTTTIFGFENDPKLVVKTLENGFTYYLYPNQTPKDTITLKMVVKVGSTDELDSEQGLAHFIEHMTFNGTKDYNKNELIKILESLGVKFGADLNAATGFMATTYKLDIKNSDENIQNALNIFANMGFKVLFNKDDLEAEKGVILAEEKNRRDANTRVFEQSIDYYFKDSIFAKRLPIGDMDIVKNSTSELLRGLYERYYQPNNVSLVVVGDFDIDDMNDKIQTIFSKIPNKKVEHKEKNIGYFNELVVFNSYDKDIHQENVQIMFEDNATIVNNYENLKNEVKNQFVARLFKLINEREKSRGDTTLNTEFYPINLYDKKVLNSFYSSVLNNDFKSAIANLFYNIKNIQKFGFLNNDFEDVKKDLLANNLAIFQASKKTDSNAIASQILDLIESGTTFLSAEDRFKNIEKAINEINLEDINKHFNEITSKSGILVDMTSKNPVNIKKEDILKIYNNIITKEEEELNLPSKILNEKLQNQEPLRQSVEGVNSVYLYEFENGANVYFKHINTKKDKVFFTAFKKGGYSNLDDIKLANFSVNLSNGSGIGEFNEYEVSKITSGQIFNYSKFINKTSLGYKGNFRVKDIKNFFDAFYVDFNNPKIDENYFNNYKINALDQLLQNEKNPDYKFAKEFNDFYYNNSHKMKFATKEDIKNLDLEKARKFIKDNFKNAGEYDFVFVGDMNEEDFIKVAKNYIGNLKGEKNPLEIKDDKIRPIKGNYEFIKNYLTENVSKNTIFINNTNIQNTPKNKLTLEFSADILNTLMRERIREEQSKVYGIVAHSTLMGLPYEYNSIQIYFTSNVSDVNSIVKDVKKIMQDIKTNFNDENELNNIKAIKKVSLEKAYQQPKFWLDSLMETLIFDEYFFSYDEMISLIDQITLEDIKRVANYAFDTRNFIVSSNVYKGIKDK